MEREKRKGKMRYKNRRDRRIITTRYCSKLLMCERHRCENISHVGPCDICQVVVIGTCFCKKKVDTVYCRDIYVVGGELDVKDGVYSCNLNCGKPLECGYHLCSEICHPGPCGDCELLPRTVNTCYCGKTSLEDEQRLSCLDPIPSCSNICMKLLLCGQHSCESLCHSAHCPTCLVCY